MLILTKGCGVFSVVMNMYAYPPLRTQVISSIGPRLSPKYESSTVVYVFVDGSTAATFGVEVFVPSLEPSQQRPQLGQHTYVV